MSDRELLFATRRYVGLRDAIVREGGGEAASVEVRTFPDGERYQRVLSQVEGRDVSVVAGTACDEDTLELYDLACSLARQGVHRLTLVVPYFGYSTMERAVKHGEVVTAKVRARLLSSIPAAQQANRILLLDLHSEGIPHYFEGDVRAVHVYAKPIVLDAIRELGGGDFVVACTDAGRAKWVESLANDLGVTASFVFKKRLDGETTQITAVSAQVDGRRVIVYDDMIRTGGSLLDAVRAYKHAGATEIAAVATHGLFPGEALARLKDCGLLTKIVVTDSHPRATELAATSGGFLEVRSVAGVLARAVGART